MLRIPIEANPALPAPVWIDVDLDAIAHNVRAFRRVLPATCRLIAVVKANAYGHGMVRVARVALQHGASELAVANVHEGGALRAAGISQPILIAGPTVPSEVPLVAQHALVPSVGCGELAAALAAVSRRYLPIELEVDTGMARHGVSPRELPALVDRIERRGKLAIAGVYTHFAATGVAESAALAAQLGAFERTLLPLRSLRGARRHACNTLGALVLPAAHLDAVRIGGGLYGFDPFHASGTRGPLTLRPALSLRARLCGLRDVPAGTPIGYGSRFVCERPSRLGLLAIGYGDGLVRELWNGAPVLVRGRRAAIVGVVSMNQTVIDVSDVPGVSLGDEVVLLGAQGDDRVLPEDRVGTFGSAYEVTTLLRPGLVRRYLGGSLEAVAVPASLDAVARRTSS
jgi:alanine racemase